jgi:ribosomal protein L22
MPSFLQNKYVKLFSLSIIGLLVLSVIWTVLNLSTNSVGLSGESLSDSSFQMRETSNSASFQGGREMDSYIPSPVTDESGYTSNLEKYETTSYSVFGSSKEFTEICDTIKNLKSDPAIHFKSLTETTNDCRATFFVEENQAEGVALSLKNFSGIEQNRSTVSVSRHRQQIESKTSTLLQQIANVENTLTAAEAQLVNLNTLMASSIDAANLASRVNESLRLIDQLTERKNKLNSQLNNLYQQSADLEERLGVVEFSTNINRSNPIFPNQDSRIWENAWDDLGDEYRDTLIALSATFLIFLLWIARAIIYLLVVIVVLRILYRFGKFIFAKF